MYSPLSLKPMIMVMIIILILTTLFIFFVEKLKNTPSMKNSFECGMETLNNKKSSFSTNFLLIIIMFMVFDVEMSFLIPTLMMTKINSNMSTLTMSFVGLLLMLMMKEWAQGTLEWKK